MAIQIQVGFPGTNTGASAVAPARGEGFKQLLDGASSSSSGTANMSSLPEQSKQSSEVHSGAGNAKSRLHGSRADEEKKKDKNEVLQVVNAPVMQSVVAVPFRSPHEVSWSNQVGSGSDSEIVNATPALEVNAAEPKPKALEVATAQLPTESLSGEVPMMGPTERALPENVPADVVAHENELLDSKHAGTKPGPEVPADIRNVHEAKSKAPATASSAQTSGTSVKETLELANAAEKQVDRSSIVESRQPLAIERPDTFKQQVADVPHPPHTESPWDAAQASGASQSPSSQVVLNGPAVDNPNSSGMELESGTTPVSFVRTSTATTTKFDATLSEVKASGSRTGKEAEKTGERHAQQNPEFQAVAPGTLKQNGSDAGGSASDSQEHASQELPARQPSTDPYSTSISHAINTAKVIQSMHGSHMSVGLHSVEYGRISIQTNLERNHLSANITVENGVLGKVVADQIPALQEALSKHQGVDAQVQVQDSSTGFSGGGHRQQPEEQKRTLSVTGRLPFRVESGSTNPITTSVLDDNRLSIRV